MAKKSADTAQSANYKLEIQRGIDSTIEFDFTALDSDGNEYDYSLRDFDEDPTILKDILAAIAATWPAKDQIKFRFQALPSGVRQITEIL